jgi:hypothetical protein
MSDEPKKPSVSKSFRFVFCASVIAAGFAGALGVAPALSQTKQEHVHQLGQTVMLFDLNKTVHIFKLTDSGGVQSVVVKDAHEKQWQPGLV